MPERYINADGVELNLPHQEGLFVTGNRRQHSVPYKTDAYGFNTLQNNLDGKNKKYSIALIGDSFIEGFHQPRTASLGKMVEDQLQHAAVTEYGMSGYDFADQLYLVHTYKEHFEQMDALVFYLKYENDLERASYQPNYTRAIKRRSLVSKIRQESKLLTYMGRLGIINQFSRFVKGKTARTEAFKKQKEAAIDSNLVGKRIANFKALLAQNPIPRTKMHLLVDTSKTPQRFIAMCLNMGIAVIDFKDALQQAEAAPTYIYDEHWNHHGRQLVAKSISSKLKRFQ